MNAVDAGEGDLEAIELRRVVMGSPENVDARIRLAQHYEAQGATELALEHYRLAGLAKPEDETNALRYATRLRKQDPTAARLELRRFAAAHAVTRTETYSLLAILDDEAGDLPIGEAMHRKALELNPGSDALHNNLGYNLLRQGRPAEALAEFRKALKLNAKSAVTQNNMALALATLEREEAAAQRPAARAAFETWKKHAGPAEAHNNLGGVYMEKGKYAEARKEFESALRLRPDLPEAWRNLQKLSSLDGGEVALWPVGQRSESGLTGWRTLAGGVGKSITSTEPVLKPASAEASGTSKTKTPRTEE